MAEPKKRRSPRKQGLHRQHLVRKLAKRVNARSPVKVQLPTGKRRRPKKATAKPRKTASTKK